jgi:tetraacyldisaccharide 4'-kinase
MIKIWRGEAPLTRALCYLPLAALAAINGLILTAREGCYRTGVFRIEKAPVPVISIGNLTMGGTGKTTVVELLSRRLKEKGFKPGVVMRGYKKKRKGTFVVDPDTESAASAGDEATMLARRTGLPVIVGKKRIDSISLGVQRYGLNIVLFDDGYQVRNVHKDVEVLVVNGTDRKEAFHLFPLGFLREPLEMAKKAAIILVNKGELSDYFASLTVGKPLFRVKYRPLHLCGILTRTTLDCRLVAGKRVRAFSGLGDNAAFFSLLRDMGAEIVEAVEFPDHHDYTVEEVQRLQSQEDAEMVITTEKDAVKIDRMVSEEHVFFLSIEAAIEEEDQFIRTVLEKARA